MQRITLTLDSGLASVLREEARRDDRPVSSVARKALSAYFAKLPTPPAAARRRTAAVKGGAR